MSERAQDLHNRSNRIMLLRSGEQADLDAINMVVRNAVAAWPLPERLKRLTLPALIYKPLDFSDHEFLLATLPEQCVGVAAWRPGQVVSRGVPALLHGLYVDAQHQGLGIGRALQAMLANRAAVAGFDGLLVKAERVSQDYFESCGYQRLSQVEHTLGYHYCYWRDLEPAAEGFSAPAME